MWGIFKHFFSHQENHVAQTLYWACVEMARCPFFYTDLKVNDTIDGRFDLVVLHVFLMTNRLAEGGQQNAKASRVSQSLGNIMIADFDRSLREMGVGDFGIGRKMRTMGEAYMGRFKAYQEAFEELSASTQNKDFNQSVTILEKSLSRNVYRLQDKIHPHSSDLAVYVLSQASQLDKQPLDNLLKGTVSFVNPQEVVLAFQKDFSEN